jgi:hypothetical protein
MALTANAVLVELSVGTFPSEAIGIRNFREMQIKRYKSARNHRD